MSRAHGLSPFPSSSSRNLEADSRLRIFILERDIEILDYLRSTLGAQYELSLFGEEQALMDSLNRGHTPDLFLIAWHDMGDTPALISVLRSRLRHLPIVMLFSSADMPNIIAATRLGVHDIVLKPLLGNDLEIAIDEGLTGARQHPAHERASEIQLNETHSFVRSSRAMRSIESQAAAVARADIPVLILGESGTGKEILALYLHKMSARSEQMYLKVNCAALPGDLIESELFGYEQGAFTGAVKSKQGKFEICNGGTLFLDEIGEMPANLQAKLLQVLQDGTFSRLGSRSPMQVDVRVVAATNINMKQAIAQKTFREDLYYRLNGFSLSLPPLRERGEEIPIFVDYFMRKSARLYGRPPLRVSDRLMDALKRHSWPGNLRELENIIGRYLVLADEEAILDEIRPSGDAAVPDRPQMDLDAEMQREVNLKRLVRGLKGEAESTAIAQVLEATGWNRKAAASDLRISYKAILYKIKQYGLAPQMRS
jgi:DNA-binding NtrC family response regulator